MENIKSQVQAYFDKNARNYITNSETLTAEDKSHIVNIGTSIICTRHEIGYPVQKFVYTNTN